MTVQPILPVRTRNSRSRAPLADPLVQRWVNRRLAASPPRATSLIITVWGDAIAPHGGAVMLSGLIDLLEPFGINERLVRTSVFRLARERWIAAKPMGRRSLYRLTRAGARRFEQAYRRIYAAGEPEWDGDWELVLGDGLSQEERKALRDELSWEGFGVLAPWVYARPSRPDSALSRITRALGVTDRVLTLRAREDGSLGGQPLSSAVMRAWPIASVASDYRRFLKSFGAVIERFRGGRAQDRDPAQCFVVRTLLIHAYRRVLLRDPQLPGALLPLDWPGAAAGALCRDFYRITQHAAERYLVATLEGPRGELPAASEDFYSRFGGLPRS